MSFVDFYCYDVNVLSKIRVTLTYLIDVHARLTILDFFSTLHALLYAYTLNYVSIFYHPTH